MKKSISAVVISSLFLIINSAYALDIQAGEWKMEDKAMHVVDLKTNQVLIDNKGSRSVTFMCYTPKMSSDSKKMEKGFSTTVDGCTTTFLESTDSKLVNDTICNNPDSKLHSIVETTKVSDTEFLITMKMDTDSPQSKMSTSNKVTQTFVGKTCSDASKGSGTK